MADRVIDTEPFDIHEVGETSEKLWDGHFTAKKRLSHRDHLKKDNVRRELLGAAPGVATERALSTAMILSELSVRLVQVPEWWAEVGNGLDLEDDNIIGLIYEAAMKVENDAIDAKKKKAQAVQDKLRAERDAEKEKEEREVAEMAATANSLKVK